MAAKWFNSLNTNSRTNLLSVEMTIFSLKMTVKSGLDIYFFFKLNKPLLTCQANSTFLGQLFCTGQQQLWRGSFDFKNKISHNFSSSFLSQNWSFQELRV
jgi:hypothetical protein